MELPDTWEELDEMALRSKANAKHPMNCLCMYCVRVIMACGDPRCEDIAHMEVKWRY